MNAVARLIGWIREETNLNVKITLKKTDAKKLKDQLESALKPCPEPTQDIDLNLENRQKAIDEYMYGPADPSNPGDYWDELAMVWNEDDIADVKKMVCGNCAAFNVSKRMKACIETGFQDEGEDDWNTVDAGELGYCQFLNFKCAAKRTCKAWVTGGPIR
jgi:hypothetical protein